MALARTRCFSRAFTASATITAGEEGVRACALAILEQHKTLLRAIDDAMYTFPSTLLQASVGQHTRHSLDHLRKPIEALLVTTHAGDTTASGVAGELVIRYDVRQRNTVIEHDRAAAIDQIERLQHSIRAVGTLDASRLYSSSCWHLTYECTVLCVYVCFIDDKALRQRLRAAFMLSADGHEFAFESTLSREMAFGVHHCIHHNALSKVLLRHHFPELPLPPDFGMAPSTTNFTNSSRGQ